MIAHAGGADESLSLVLLAAALWTAWAARSRLKGLRFPRTPRYGAYVMIAGAVVLAVASAWLPRAILGPDSTGMTTSPGSRPTPATTLTFASPQEGATVSGQQLNVVLDLQGGRVVTQETPVTSDTGHIHVTVDGKLVSMTFGTVQVLDLRPYDPGNHVLEAEFVAADHLSFEPPVVAHITFTISEEPT